MSGHSKWAKIRHQKATKDSRRGKAFSQHAKQIAVAARAGTDPEKNGALALAIANAKKDNVPAANIERAIRTGAGLDKDAATIEELSYEGYAPGGIPLLVSVLTDNKNRAAADIRHLFSKLGGSLGGPGSVAFLFERKGEVVCQAGVTEEEKLLELAAEIGAEDFEKEEELALFLFAPEDLAAGRAALEEKGKEIESATLVFRAKKPAEVDDAAREKAEKLAAALEDLEDVDAVAIG
jgi:YebC/PmpR family DNA-binding regulatory protein